MESIWNIGITWNFFFQSFGSWPLIPMKAFSFTGTEIFFLLILTALYWCTDTRIGLRVGIIVLLSLSINDALKMVFHGPRPYWYSSNLIAYARESSFGVPSGHAEVSFGLWGMLAASINKWWAWLIAALIILLVSISRLYLGVHFPHDVILGLLMGALLLWLVLRFWEPVVAIFKRLSPGQQYLASFLGSIALILLSLIPFLWLKITNWQPPQAWAQYTKDAISLKTTVTTTGTLFGLLAGSVWLNHRGGLNAKGLIQKRILRYILGLIGLMIIHRGLKTIFEFIAPDAEAMLPYLLRYIRYFLLGAFISALAPFVFIKLKLATKNA